MDTPPKPRDFIENDQRTEPVAASSATTDLPPTAKTTPFANDTGAITGPLNVCRQRIVPSSGETAVTAPSTDASSLSAGRPPPTKRVVPSNAAVDNVPSPFCGTSPLIAIGATQTGPAARLLRSKA